jgi:hypothetical protein
MAEIRRRARGRHVGWAMRTPSSTEADTIKTTRCESSLRISGMSPPQNHAASYADYDNGTLTPLPYLKFLLGFDKGQGHRSRQGTGPLTGCRRLPRVHGHVFTANVTTAYTPAPQHLPALQARPPLEAGIAQA